MNRPLLSTAARVRSALALAVMTGVTTTVLAQEPATSGHDHAGATPAAAKGCAMMAQHQGTTAMTASDQRLTELIAKMNAAKGEARVDAIAAVVSELAAQRTQMNQMQNGMMERMKSDMNAKHAADPAKK